MGENPAQNHEELASNNLTKTNGTNVPNKRHEELQYLDLVKEILATGEHRPDRYEPMFWDS